MDNVKLPCAFGTLVAEVLNDDGEYAEIAIDLVKPDGTVTQVCVAGTWDSSDEKNLHVYVWDGDHEDAAWSHMVNPDGEYSF